MVKAPSAPVDFELELLRDDLSCERRHAHLLIRRRLPERLMRGVRALKRMAT
jgi:hypothetical protein